MEKMSIVKIRDVNVQFPYEKPYDIQVEYMTKVVDCLENKRHGVLESPTGTGKTLCLLAPVTSWLRSRKLRVSEDDQSRDPSSWCGRKRERVWYTARTHSQIAQTVTEVRRCDIDGLSVRVMGARDQLCVHPVVSKEKEAYVKTVMCKDLVKTRACRYYRELEYERHSPVVYKNGEVLDIEDLVSAGRSVGICPYYLAKQAKDHADVVLLPYNYIIDRDSRDLGVVSLFNNIVIFDEGHNVPQTCEDGFEFSISSADLANGIARTQELMKALSYMRETMPDDDDTDWAQHVQNSYRLTDALTNLESGLSAMPIANQLLPLTGLTNFMEKAGINFESAKALLSALEAFKADSIRLQLSKEILSTFQLMERMLNTLYGATIRSFSSEIVEQSFKFSVAEDTNHVNNSKKLSLFCFNPSFGLQDVLLQGIETLIITSGTLSPLFSFIHELSLPNPITLENGHIAAPCQVPFMILGTGVNSIKMDASFRNRSESSYMYSLGMTLTNLISSVPDGVLLLFSSYSVMQSLKEYWEREGGIWNRMNNIKKVYTEPRSKEEFINCMENYRRSIDAGNGAILMGVLRGKISEGMDFKNQYCRAVFVIGVPFPPIKDPRVKGKEKYAESLTVLNPETKKMQRLYESYMSVEAMKATNQAIGRVIRHGQDYGAIILVDYRFAWPRLFGNISKWLRGSQASEVNFMMAKKALREFFKNINAGKLGVPEVRCQKVNANGDPISANSKFELYDHKTAMRNRVQPTPIHTATGLDRRNYASTIQYEDSIDEKSDLLAMYRDRDSASSSSSYNSSSSSRSIFESMDSTPSTRIEYREIDISQLKFKEEQDSQAGKRSNISPIADEFNSAKKNRRRIITNTPFFKSTASQDTQDDASVKRAGLISYFENAKQVLSPSVGAQFKEVACRYMRGDVPLSIAVTALRDLLKAPETIHLLKEFVICVKSEHMHTWHEMMGY